MMTMRWHILLLLLLTVGLMGQRAHLNPGLRIKSLGCIESSTSFLCNDIIIQSKEILAAASTTTRVRLRDADTGGEGYYKLEACNGGSGWCDFSMYGFTGFVSSELWFMDGSANQWQHKVAFHNTQDIETDADLIADGDVQVATCAQIGSLTVGSAACICRDSTDRLYHDVNCDETKDDDDEFLDGGLSDSIILCGQLANSGTVYFPPNTDRWGGGVPDLTIGGTVCDDEEETVEATADTNPVVNAKVVAIGMVCRVSSAGSNGVVFTMRASAADLTPTMTCTVATGETDCAATARNTTIIGTNPFAMKVVTTEDLSLQDGWCRLYFALKP